MEEIGVTYSWKIPWLSDYSESFFQINYHTVFHTWVVIGGIILFALAVRRRMGSIPGRLQIVAEMYVRAFDNLVTDSLEFESKEANRKYLPLIGTLFIFVALCNYIGFLPPTPLLGRIVPNWSGWSEPTSDLNTTLGLGIMGFCIVIYTAIRVKGLWGYIKSYAEPIFIMAPLNVVGEIAKVISISFRLFGNIKGGAIIILVVSFLVRYLVLPVPLSLFFVFFVGTVQAFVFTMLTLTYISVAIK